MGLILSDISPCERILLVFTAEGAASAFAGAIHMPIDESLPDPPRWAARWAGSLLRLSHSTRDQMLMCGMRTGKSIEERGLEKRKETAATEVGMGYSGVRCDWEGWVGVGWGWA